MGGMTCLELSADRPTVTYLACRCKGLEAEFVISWVIAALKACIKKSLPQKSAPLPRNCKASSVGVRPRSSAPSPAMIQFTPGLQDAKPRKKPQCFCSSLNSRK